MYQRIGTHQAKLKDDVELRTWFNNLAQGSIITAEVYLRRLDAFCDEVKMTPQELAQIAPKELYNLLIEYVSKKTKEINPKTERPFAPSYINSIVNKAVKSWLAHNDIAIKKVKVKGATSRPNVDEEQVPTRGELKQIFLAATMRSRVSCVLMAHAGVRPEVLGNYEGTDGLRIKDLPEMIIESGKVSFESVPTRIIVREELSKIGHSYTTFLSEEGCEYLRAYLENRIAEGEEITPESDLIAPKVRVFHGKDGKPIPDRLGNTTNTFMRTTKIGMDIKQAIRKAGFNMRPYVLRCYFATQIELKDAGVKKSYQTFWLGHKGDMDSLYSVNKKRLTKEMIEDMREVYRKAQPVLQTVNMYEGPTQEQLEAISRAEARRGGLALTGLFTADEIAGLDIENMTDEAIIELVQGKQQPKNMTVYRTFKEIEDMEEGTYEMLEGVAAPPGKVAVRLFPEPIGGGGMAMLGKLMHKT